VSCACSNRKKIFKKKNQFVFFFVLFQWLKDEELKANFVLLPLLRTYKFTQRRYGFNRQKEKKNILKKERKKKKKKKTHDVATNEKI